MSKTNAFETAFLNHIFKNQAISNIGDASGLPASATPGSLFIGLLTSGVTETGGGTECTYTGYGRVALARGADFTVSGNQVVNANDILFGERTDGGAAQTVVGFCIYTASSAGDKLFYGAVSPQIQIAEGSIPKIPAGSLVITEN